MGEREPRKEIIEKGELFFLSNPGTSDVFSGYGLTTRWGSSGYLVGLLMVDRPNQADHGWLSQIQETFGEYQLVPMTATSERGIVCRMQIEQDSRSHLRKFSSVKIDDIQNALEPLLAQPPKPVFSMRWDQERNLWASQMIPPNELPAEIRGVFEKVGYGCLAAEADVGVVHVCHAPDADIDGFENKPVMSRWQLIKMPTAPLIRLELIVVDRPQNPFRFESFLNVGEEDQANILAQLATQDRLYLTFYGDELNYRFTKTVPHNTQQWQHLDELVVEAEDYWSRIPAGEQDFDRAKAEFMKYSQL